MSLGRLKIILFFALIALIGENTYAQTSISGVINNYAPVTSISSSCNSLNLTASTGFNIGDKVLLIQMKGATVVGTNTSAFGNISAIGNAGNYEFNEILDIQGSIIYLKYTLLKTYTPEGLQLISIPQYIDVSIDGTLTAKQWDGTSGGVLVFEASGNITFNADINVEGFGFNGGSVNSLGTINSCAYGLTTYYAAAGSNGLAGKGEGISAFVTGKEVARANQANAGGGGHSSNTGAGGGSNYGKGGIGGRQSSKTIGTGCNATTGAQGMGGISLSSYYSSNKIFMGGGGGGGQQNNYVAPGPPNSSGSTPGNPGGAIVIIRAQSITGNGHTIYAAGTKLNYLFRTSMVGYCAYGCYPCQVIGGGLVYMPNCKMAWGDSGGGGGGGGTVLLSTNAGYSNSLNVDVSGGYGDTTFTEDTYNLGPGGGGGGGVLWVNDATTNTNITTNIAGGVSGTSYNWIIPDNACQCAFQATNGDPGTVLHNLVIPESTTPFSNTCASVPISLLSFTGKQINGKVQLNWSTTMEIDNDHFVLEKSTDGSHFEFLTSLKGNGNSEFLHNYSYSDYYPYTGANYYRLKQYDYDGKEHTDGHVYVSFSGSGEVIEKLYPNPFADELILEGSDAFSKEKTTLKIYDILGTEIPFSSSYEGQKITLQTASLSKGLYHLLISNGSKTEMRKITKE